MVRRLCLGFLLVLLAAVGLAQTKKQEPTFTERVDVSLRTILAIVTDSGGKLLTKPLSAEDVEVREDGTPVKIVSLDLVGGSMKRPAPGRSGLTAAEAASPGPVDVKRILYFDSSLLRRGSVQRVLDGFLKSLDGVVAGGPLEVVLADPDPKVVISATRDVSRCRDALKSSFPGGRFERDRLQQIRTAFLQEETLAGGRSGQAPAPNIRAAQARSAMQQEIQVIRHSLDRLGDWASARATRDPAILFLVIDGFDSDVSEFYRNSIQDDTTSRQLRQEFAYTVQKLVGDASAVLAGRSLLTIPISAVAADVTFAADAATIGLRPFMDSPDRKSVPFLFLRPMEPLNEIAETTGGEVLTRPDRFEDVLDRLAGAVAITYRMAGPSDGKVHQLSVRCLRQGVVLRATRSVVASTDPAARVVEALEKPVPSGDLPVTASVEPLELKSDKKRRARLFVSVDLAGVLESIRGAGPPRLRVTVAFDNEHGSPSVHQQEFEVTRLGTGTVWKYDAELQGLPRIGRVAVTVEELATGARGTARADLAGAAGEGGSPTGTSPRELISGGDEIPAEFEIVESTTSTAKGKTTVSAKLHVTIQAEAILPVIAREGAWRPRVTIEAVGPDFRAVIAKSELSLPFDIAIDHWDFFLPITWPADAYRLLVTVIEPTTGAHAGAVLELTKER